MCRNLRPRLRAASSVRSSSTEPTPWLCQGLLDREGGFGLACYRRADRPQLGRAAQGPVDEEAMNDGVDAERQIGIVA